VEKFAVIVQEDQKKQLHEFGACDVYVNTMIPANYMRTIVNRLAAVVVALVVVGLAP
jgi:hypothetical protein